MRLANRELEKTGAHIRAPAAGRTRDGDETGDQRPIPILIPPFLLVQR